MVNIFDNFSIILAFTIRSDAATNKLSLSFSDFLSAGTAKSQYISATLFENPLWKTFSCESVFRHFYGFIGI